MREIIGESRELPVSDLPTMRDVIAAGLLKKKKNIVKIRKTSKIRILVSS